MKCNNGFLVLSLRLSCALLLCNKPYTSFLDKFFVCGKHGIISCQIYFPFLLYSKYLTSFHKKLSYFFCISQVHFEEVFFFCSLNLIYFFANITRYILFWISFLYPLSCNIEYKIICKIEIVKSKFCLDIFFK